MKQRKRAGEPEVPKRAAGAPEAPTGPAGAPTREGGPRDPRTVTDPTREPKATGHPAKPDADAAAEDSVGGDVVEHDIDELLDDARKERDEYLELAQRTKADFENYRRRAKSGLARELVPVLDNLERALRAAGIDPDAANASDADGEGLSHGVLLVYRDLRAALERAGVETYDPAGERFDPAWHEALSTRDAEDTEPGIVLETVEKGYRLDGQVLRAARVIVSAEG